MGCAKRAVLPWYATTLILGNLYLVLRAALIPYAKVNATLVVRSTDSVCHPSSGCQFVVNVSRPCVLTDPCLEHPRCNATGGCVGDLVECSNSANTCESAVCVAGMGCSFVNNTATCNDNLKCTVNDMVRRGGARDNRRGTRRSRKRALGEKERTVAAIALILTQTFVLSV